MIFPGRDCPFRLLPPTVSLTPAEWATTSRMAWLDIPLRWHWEDETMLHTSLRFGDVAGSYSNLWLPTTRKSGLR
jgi:hypothetical protein